MDNRKLLVIGILAGILFFVVGGNFFVNKVADRVIQRLQKDYSPSPYGPGINPDKLDVQKIKN